MTNWLDALDDSRGIRAIYGDDVPPLTGVTMNEVCLHHDGPRVVLRFDLSRYPANPPKKWADQGFTTVQLQLMLVDIHELSIAGWSNESVVDLSLERTDNGVVATTSGGLAQIRIRALSAIISAISAYQTEDVSA
jgi:hypothetical protein